MSLHLKVKSFFGFLIEHEYLVCLERVVNLGSTCVDVCIGVDDRTDYGVMGALVSRNNAYVTTHYLNTAYLTGKRTVVVEVEALGTDTNGNVTIVDTGDVENCALANVKLAALNLTVKYVDRRSSKELRNEEVGGIVINILGLAYLLNNTKITTVFVTHDQEEAMSISDMIVVMKLGIVQQVGKPQEVYDNPTNLFVAKFLGTPPINVFNGKVKAGKLYIGENAVLDVPGITDRDVFVGIRPEGFVVDPNGALTCNVNGIEVMGRDVSIVSTNENSINPVIRSIINSDEAISADATTVNYSLKSHKVFVFDKETEERLYFEVK